MAPGQKATGQKATHHSHSSLFSTRMWHFLPWIFVWCSCNFYIVFGYMLYRVNFILFCNFSIPLLPIYHHCSAHTHNESTMSLVFFMARIHVPVKAKLCMSSMTFLAANYLPHQYYRSYTDYRTTNWTKLKRRWTSACLLILVLSD